MPGGKRYYEEVFNTDSLQWGGSGVCNEGLLTVEDVPSHGRGKVPEDQDPAAGRVILKGPVQAARRTEKNGTEGRT